MNQADKDRLLADLQILVNDANGLAIDAPVVGPVPSDLQAQLDTANATVVAQRQALTDKQSQNDALVVANAHLQSVIDMIKAALA